MKPLTLVDANLDALRVRHRRELVALFRPERVSAENHGFFPEYSVGRVPDLRDVLRGPGDAAVDVLPLPEALLRLEADFEQLAAVDRRHAGGIVGGKVMVQRGHQVGRDTVQAEVGRHAGPLSVATVGDLYTVLLESYRL